MISFSANTGRFERDGLMTRFFTILIVVGFISISVSNLTYAARFEEGIAYQKITPEQPTSTKAKVEVVELFWYGCPHCHRFESFIDRWLKTKSENIEFVRIPAVLQEHWEIHARAYYTAEALGVIEKIHPALFTAIHAHKRKLDTDATLEAFFAEQGVSTEMFQKAFRSFGVDAKVRHAREMGKRYGVGGTPAIIINGKFRTDGQICKCGFAELLELVDEVAAKEKT
jgi:thiol:disulfide interchange protein DsbA